MNRAQRRLMGFMGKDPAGYRHTQPRIRPTPAVISASTPGWERQAESAGRGFAHSVWADRFLSQTPERHRFYARQDVLQSSPAMASVSASSSEHEYRNKDHSKDGNKDRNKDHENEQERDQTWKPPLSPAPAADWSAPGSEGHALPQDLLKALEGYFKADLGRLRVHRDSAAESAARERKAEAFTAGAHLIFGKDEYRPQSREGLDLIAHEVAHALQQTSRGWTGERRAAGTTGGAGPVQKREAFEPKTVREVPALSDLTLHHLEAATSEARPDVLRAVLQLSEIFSPDYAATVEGADDLAHRTFTEHEFDEETDGYKALICDALKAVDRPQAAGYLLAENPGLQTFFHHDASLQAALDQMGDGWRGAIFAREPFVWYYPALFRELFRLFLLGPTRAIPSLDHWQHGSFAAKQEEYENLAADPGAHTLVENELFHYGLQVLRAADRRREDMMQSARTYVDENYAGSRPLWKRSHTIRKFGEEIVTFIRGMDSGSNADSILFRALSDSMDTILLPTARAYGQAIDLLNSLTIGGGITQDAVAEIRHLANLEALNVSKNAFISFVRPVLELVDGRFPSARQYNATLQRVRRGYANQLWTLFEQPMIQFQRRASSDSTTPEELELVVAYLVVWSIANDFGGKLEGYDYQADRIFPGARPDVRVAHRLDVAAGMDFAGRLLGWQPLSDLAQLVLQATQTGETQIALLGDWRQDEESDFERILTDFNPDNPMHGAEPLTNRHVWLFFQMRYLNALSDAIEALLLLEEGDYSEYREPIINRVTDAHETFTRPRRYHLEGGRVAYFNPVEEDGEEAEDSEGAEGQEEEREPREEVYDLIRAHPKTRDFVETLGPGHVLTSRNTNWRRGNTFDFYFWFLPPLADMARELRNISGLVELVDAFRARSAATEEGGDGGAEQEAETLPPLTFTPPVIEEPAEPGEHPMTCDHELGEEEVPAPAPAPEGEGAAIADAAHVEEALSDEEAIRWIWDLLEATGENAGLQGPVGEALTAHLRPLHAETRERFMCLRRRSLVHERKMAVAHFFRPKLREYSPHDIRTYSLPTRALEELWHFRNIITPEEDKDFHVNAALVELVHPGSPDGNDIHENLRDMTRYELVFGFLNLLVPAAAHLGSHSETEYAPYLTAEERANAATWLGTGRSRLESVIARMREQQTTMQTQFGMEGSKLGDDPVYPEVNEAGEDVGEYVPQGRISSILSPGSVSTQMPLQGLETEIVRVEQDFIYHPDYGIPGNPGYKPSLLYVRGGGDEMEDAPRREGWRCVPLDQRAGLLLMQARFGTDLRPVHGDNDRDLRILDDAVTMEVISQNLESLGDFLDSFANVILDLAEFVPGYGQMIMIARLAAVVLQFVMSGDFEEVKRRLLEDPQAILQAIERLFGTEMTGEKLLEYLLFNAPHLDELRTAAPRESEPPRSRRSRGVMQKFIRIISRMGRLGILLLGSFGRLQVRMQTSFFGMGAFVMRRPILNRVLEIGLNNYQALEGGREFVSELQGRAEALQDFPEKINDFIQTLSTLEIPQELLPMAELLDLIIDVVVERLGAKYELAADVILTLLEAAGQKDRLLQAVASRIPEALDPNTYWGRFVEDHLQELFTDFRDELVGSMGDFFEGLGLGFNQNAVGNPTVEAQAGDFPETEGLLKDKSGASDISAASPISSAKAVASLKAAASGGLGGGVPLPSAARTRAESSFGQDFGQVRLHRGSTAESITSPLGAEALTSGSHVVLPDSHGLDTRSGRHVLNHELAHVVQQGGSSPLGSGKSDGRPASGRPGLGLRLDPAREAEAHHAAEGVEQGVPIDGGKLAGKGSGGWQPNLSPGTMFRILDTLVTFETLQENYASVITEVERGGGGNRLSQDQRRQIQGVASHLYSNISLEAATTPGVSSERGMRIAEPFDRARAEIAEYFRGKWTQTRFQQFVNELADRALKPKRRGRGRSEANQPQAYDLDFSRFRTSLQNFVFSQTGLSMTFDLNFQGAGSTLTAADEDLRLDQGSPLKDMRLTYVYLPAIGPTAGLWNLVIDSTFGHSEENRRTYKPRARSYLAAKGIEPGIYDTGAGAHLKFSQATKEILEARLQLDIGSREEAFPPSELPSSASYLQMEGGTAHPVYGHIGLRQGLHKEKANGGSQSGYERDSHHVPQFLLLEYFRNWKTNPLQKPFRHPMRLLEGVVSAGTRQNQVPDEVDAFEPASGTRIEIEQFTGGNISSRGPEMPCLLIARPTHVYADLHVHGEPDDDPGLLGQRASPAYAVQNKFKEGMPDSDIRNALMNVNESAPGRTLEDIHESAGGPLRIRNNIHQGILAAYRWVHNDMETKLERGLKTSERFYYNTLAEEGGQSDRITEGEMMSTKTNFMGWTDGIYASKGWTL